MVNSLTKYLEEEYFQQNIQVILFITNRLPGVSQVFINLKNIFGWKKINFTVIS